MEDSVAVYKGYAFMADNGGNLMCLNLNTLQLVWVQDVLDDSNSTPVLEIENGHLYLYVSTSFRHFCPNGATSHSNTSWMVNGQTSSAA